MNHILAFALDAEPVDWLRSLPAVRVEQRNEVAAAVDWLRTRPRALLVLDHRSAPGPSEDLLLQLRGEDGSAQRPVLCCIDAAIDPAAARRLTGDLGVQRLMIHPLEQRELTGRVRALLGLEEREEEVAASLLALWERFRQTTLARVEALEEAVRALGENRLDEQRRAHAEREAHKLAGSAGTFGLPRASRLAREVEQMLGGSLPPAQAAALEKTVRELRAELEQGPGRSAPASDPTTPRLLLVVDEDVEFVATLQRHAQTFGFRVVGVRDAGAARRQLLEWRPDLVLLDLSVDRDLGTGFALLRAFSTLSPPVPVIALTTTDVLMDRVEAARLGARLFLQKPLPAVRILSEAAALFQRLRPTRPRVLVVDDDPHTPRVLRLLLEGAGEEVEVVGLAEPLSFWATLETTAPDLLVLDVDMPSIGGIELCRVVRGDPRWSSIPVLFLTARTDPDTIRQVFDAGADDFVAKPVVGPELVTRILNRLERSQLLRSLSETDPLTGIANRRRALELIERLHGLARRHGQPLSFVVLDVDHFKGINDRYGHALGDQVLRRLADLLGRHFRGEDVVGRWGGEEFVLGMYGMSGHDGERRLGSVLEAFRRESFGGDETPPLHVAFSAGVAEFPRDAEDVDGLFRAADEALYRAKAEGRAKVLQARRAGPS